MKKTFLFLFLTFLFSTSIFAALEKDATSETSGMLKHYLRKYPESDTDKDGVLSWWEKEQHISKDMLGEKFPEGTVHKHVDIPMRDGYVIMGELFLPKGDGPFPVVLVRAGYGRWRGAGYGKRYIGKGFAFITTDLRKYDKGAHDVFKDAESSKVQIQDTYDTIDWIVKQKWAKDKVGTVGGSGNGFASTMGFWSFHPNYTVCAAGNNAGNTKYYWGYHNATPRSVSHSWLRTLGYRNTDKRPTLPNDPYNYDAWTNYIIKKAEESKNYYFNGTGWYDPLCQGALDDFTALQNTGKAFVTISARGHGGTTGFGETRRFRYPENHADVNKVSFPDMDDLLLGKEPSLKKSTIKYFLMGDVKDANAPGNRWIYAHAWPPQHKDVPYYLNSDGTLSTGKVNEEGVKTYKYDPQNPAPTFGGHWSWSGKDSGPHDQRPLRTRGDVLYFETPPLTEALNVTGRISAKLYFSSTADDTAFVVKLVDIYPDGYEAIIRESSMMARYASGIQNPAPIKAGKVYSLDIDMWSTAQVFNKGHKIAVLVTSSSAESYEVHPNSFEQVPLDVSWKYQNRKAPEYQNPAYKGRASENSIHMSEEHPSAIILPIVPLP